MKTRPPASSPNPSRRQWLGSALLGAAAATASDAQTSCEATPYTGFTGTVGRTAADSTPGRLVTPQARPGSPDVLYIVRDDTGFSDLQCYGSEISTPNINALAAGGLFYNNFHGKAFCSPTRASLLTGRNCHSAGMKELAGEDQGYPHSRGRVTPAAATVAQVLRANGYSTLGVGKWHLVPARDMRASSDRTHWPLQKGFDRWYGFLSGWTDQDHPDLVEDNHAVERPDRTDYHFSVDIVDKALGMAGDHVGADAKKPFFLYLAFGATHAPIQVPKSYIEKYLSDYEKGWDRIRAERFERQREMGIISADTKLPPRNPGDPAWTDMSAHQRAVYTRFMATLAGFLEHADEQLGRVIEWLKEKQLFDNTAIFFLSDNGGAPETGTKGGFVHPYGDPTTVEQMYERLDELGTEIAQPLYPRTWAMASDTAFKYYKLWPYAGGVLTPFIVSWPEGIKSKGLRKQFVDVIDITATVSDITGIQPPASFDGVYQIPVQGKSIRATFDDSQSPDQRDTQYFDLWGSRGIWHKGWKAVGMHVAGTDFERDQWELYHVTSGFSESTDLAPQNPAKLEELKKLWWSEAAKYGALPLLEAPASRSRTYDQALPKH